VEVMTALLGLHTFKCNSGATQRDCRKIDSDFGVRQLCGTILDVMVYICMYFE